MSRKRGCGGGAGCVGEGYCGGGMSVVWWGGEYGRGWVSGWAGGDA